MSGFAILQAWFLLLAIVAVPLVWWRSMRRRSRPAIGFSSSTRLAAAGRSVASRLRWLVPALRTLAVILLVIGLARPIKANESTQVFVDGIAIEVVVDRSGSMLALDFQGPKGELDRISAVKGVVTQFVRGDKQLAGRQNDLIGMVTFARYADSLSPPTLDHEYTLEAMEGIKPALGQGEDGTAIGDGLALAAEKLRDLAEHRSKDETRKIKSRVVILLTDGENNAGDIEPMAAAELCKSLGIKVYTIGVGSRGSAKMPVITSLGIHYQLAPVSIDEDLLREMAAATGGQYFRASDSASLRKIYETIDKLEKTETEQRRYSDATDIAVEPVKISFGGAAGHGVSFTMPPFLLGVVVLLAAELLLAHTRFRSIP